MKEKYLKFKKSPFFLFAILLFSILLVEMAVMFMLPLLLPKGTSELTENLIDGLLLAILVSPILWKLVISPLRGDAHLAREKAQNIINSSTTGILSVDEHGIINSYNFAIQKMLALPTKNIIKANYQDIFPTLKELKLEDFKETELTYSRSGKEPKYFLIKNVKSYGNDGLFYSLYIDDLTEKKKTEKIIEIQNENAKASARLATLGEMAGGVAHELNTPLGTLKLLIGETKKELSEVPDLDRITVYNTEMDRTTDRIANIVRGMKSLTHDGSQDPFEDSSIGQIIEDTVSTLREKFKEHKVELRIPAIDSNLKIHCRPSEIGKVFFNLLLNALDATERLDEKWVELVIARSKNQIEIKITDSGNGIPVGIIDKIFNPFFTTKEVGKGTGLGLSVSLGIIKAHGGEIKYNQVSTHTQFVVTLDAL